MTCKEHNQLDLVDYLSSLGFEPAKIRNNDYWYNSPFRNEQTPSFKVNRKFNVWFDHGLQKGGRLVDFGILFFKCSVADFLLRATDQNFLSFQQQPGTQSPPFSGAGEKERIVVLETRHPIRIQSLRNYLEHRKIPMQVADRFCVEAVFSLYDRKHTVIGFKNSAGGYELRSPNFKGSSSPKDVTLIGKNHSNQISLFEGFMDFLSYQTIHHRKSLVLSKEQPNFLILNSIGFIEKVKPILDQYPVVNLFLDRDAKGMSITKELMSQSSKYRDQSQAYQNYKDLNEFLMNHNSEVKQSQSRGMRL